jgi:Spy/CpxP family protein refolding chaperone
MKKRILITAVILATVALAAAPLVLAGPRGRFGGHGMHGEGMELLGHLRHAKEELGLSDQQVDQIKAIFAEVREQNGTYREQLHSGYHGAAEVLLANPNDIAAAQKILDEQTATERVLKTNFLNAASKALSVLTAEQRAKLSTMIEEHAERHGRRGR